MYSRSETVPVRGNSGTLGTPQGHGEAPPNNLNHLTVPTVSTVSTDSRNPYIETVPVIKLEGKCPTETLEPSETWAEWKAAMLNRLFQEQGKTRQPGRITATTVRHGMKEARY